ncbi:putative ribonuclease H-like domain-containing protein [Tanacetum coccineum]
MNRDQRAPGAVCQPPEPNHLRGGSRHRNKRTPCGGLEVVTGEVGIATAVSRGDGRDGGEVRRVKESGVGDRIDPVVRSTFGVSRKIPPEKFSGGGDVVVARMLAGEDDRRWRQLGGGRRWSPENFFGGGSRWPAVGKGGERGERSYISLGSTIYQSFALRNFDLEDMEFESTQEGTNPIFPNSDVETNKKNDLKARGLLLMALPNEHQLTFSQYPDAKSMFAAIKTRFRGNAATKKTQKTLLKQQYENFRESSVESLDSIFNRLQKIVSRLAILGVVIAQEDLNSKFLSSLPPEWNTHVVVWMNKPEVKTMSIDDLYNNFKIIEQKVKKTIGTSSGAQNLAFMTALSTSSTNDANTASPQVSAASPNVNVASSQVCTASVSDNTVYAFMVENPNGSNVLHQDLEQIHEDDLEVMNLKWQLSLLSKRAKKYYQRTGKKIFINANDTAGYDKSKVECYNCHKLGHFTKECRAPRSKDGQFRNQDNTRKKGNNEDTSSKEMLAIDGVGFDWSDTAEEQVQTNMALMAFLDSEGASFTQRTISSISVGGSISSEGFLSSILLVVVIIVMVVIVVVILIVIVVAIVGVVIVVMIFGVVVVVDDVSLIFKLSNHGSSGIW